jgi:hypothetical protein
MELGAPHDRARIKVVEREVMIEVSRRLQHGEPEAQVEGEIEEIKAEVEQRLDDQA